MTRFLTILATLLFLGACADVQPSDAETSNIDVPRDHEGDVDEPTIE